jgi:hypothetical protein
MSNKNRFFPIFQNDGEPSTHTGSRPRSNKPAAKRARQRTPGPPHPPAAQTRLLLRQLPNPQQPCLTGPSPPCTISFVTTAPTSRCSPHPSSAATPRSKSLTHAATSWNLSMMTSTLHPSRTCQEIIADLKKQVAALTARPSPAPSPATDPVLTLSQQVATHAAHPSPTSAPAPVADPVLWKKVEALTQQVAALVARPAASPRPSKTQQPAPHPIKARATKSAPTRSPNHSSPSPNGFTPVSH